MACSTLRCASCSCQKTQHRLNCIQAKSRRNRSRGNDHSVNQTTSLLARGLFPQHGRLCFTSYLRHLKWGPWFTYPRRPTLAAWWRTNRWIKRTSPQNVKLLACCLGKHSCLLLGGTVSFRTKKGKAEVEGPCKKRPRKRYRGTRCAQVPSISLPASIGTSQHPHPTLVKRKPPYRSQGTSSLTAHLTRRGPAPHQRAHCRNGCEKAQTSVSNQRALL